ANYFLGELPACAAAGHLAWPFNGSAGGTPARPHRQNGCATFRPLLLEGARVRDKLKAKCGAGIPKPKMSCKQLNVESVSFNAVAPLGWRAWNNHFSACSKPLARIHNAKDC